ncbi:penicillin-binding protein 1B [Pleionea litopenaei]|uniref:Penicillin-binding protein 1B n=1 Tax=Pleionea litopenaei TaxID=3070815 RepID=A0AA51RX21_9GAMM|nr:penicillin-binding protein 1B [Pleionea sp. HL-JVS1]WMS89160.1 penicillin-binding protein 1B [Pleionea sp. HL-JVS1]
MIKKIILRLFLVGLVFFIGLVIYSDAEIKEKFDNNRWLVPAKVFSRSLSLIEGSSITQKQLLMELKLLNYRTAIKALEPGQFEHYGSDFIIYIRGFNYSDGFYPARKISLKIDNGQVIKSRVLDGEKGINSIRLEPKFIGRVNPLVNEDRELVTLDKLPLNLVEALLVSEDREFFDHIGISFKGIARALTQNVSAGKITQGGSTLTQQLVKNYFLTNERTLWRKGREAIMALTLEWRYSKDEILQAYINEVYLGQDGGRAIHGFAKASRFYFDRDISQLNLSQVATLVALVRGPSYYDPRRHGERALARRNLILEQLQAHNHITEEELSSAKQRSLQVVAKASSQTSSMPAVIGMVGRQLKQHYTVDQLNHDDLSVYTTIDPQVQNAAEQALKNRVAWITREYPSVPDELQGAMIVSSRFSGDILAIVGDRNPNYDGFNRAIDAYRQTGSAIKPFVYLTALQRASKYSLTSKINDRAFSLTASDGSLWKPQNYDKKEHGDVSLQEALVNSYNLSTARLALDVGLESIISLLYDAGFRRQLKAFPSLALGAQEMSPYELLKLYQVLATQGLKVESSVISSVTAPDGSLLDRYGNTAEQVIAPEAIYLVNQSLQKVVSEGTAEQLNTQLQGLNVAGKTGTTDDLKDSWFAGFSANYVAVSWLGMDSNESMLLTGSTGAMRVWGDFIRQVETTSLNLQPPAGIVLAKEGWFGDCLPFIAGAVPQDYSLCD